MLPELSIFKSAYFLYKLYLSLIMLAILSKLLVNSLLTSTLLINDNGLDKLIITKRLLPSKKIEFEVNKYENYNDFFKVLSYKSK